MKKLQIIILLAVVSLCNAQEKSKIITKPVPGGIIMAAQDENDEPINYDINQIFKIEEVSIKPDYPNGLQAFYTFFNKNFIKPSETELKGKIYLSFIIEKDGAITSLKVLRDIGYGTGLEAIRVLKMSDKWIPAQKNGEKVRSMYNLTIPIE